MTNPKKYDCVLCKKECEGYGNNPAPLSGKGKCCDDCNRKVVSARIIAGINKEKKV